MKRYIEMLTGLFAERVKSFLDLFGEIFLHVIFYERYGGERFWIVDFLVFLFLWVL